MEYELSLDEIHQVTLEVLQSFHELCEKLNLTYFLAFGTLLGAIRHQGFIPWDDDADIWMLRNDYECLVNYCDEHQEEIKPFKLANRKNTDNYYFGISRYSNMDYKYISTNFEKTIDIGVFVDIYPLDSYGNDLDTATRILRKMQKENTKIQRYVNGYGDSIIKTCLKMPFHIGLKIIFGKNYLKKFDVEIERYIKNVTKETDRYVGIPTWSNASKPELLEKSWFMERKLTNFENYKFYVPKAYKEILSRLYGDYMKLPPKKERNPYHNYKIVKRNDK